MYTRRILLSRLKEWAHSYQKLPTAKGILKDPNIPALSTYVRNFENWNESLRQVGFQPRKKLSKEIKEASCFRKG
ncbi:hypothetical protein CN425_01910 [Bacillus cereus]|uniref:Uncharacterized protein n=1 Tax=Bacillus cereus TaxID=1396 RepID=A0A2A9UQI8_BACCE|nr:hypothetical protein [Bacillus cereus]EJS67782.1 hypothetical protein ICU_03008 [Bacillus cereus BAG2X1-1]PEA06813.1 hypothetical protein CON38_26125 [Bacillus cereus]PEW06724.1 hypothetical protein CN425_01910 [Bacillus cereus]PFI26280.1 hypothetical protein COI75_02460 [Bacillus cereus]